MSIVFLLHCIMSSTSLSFDLGHNIAFALSAPRDIDLYRRRRPCLGGRSYWFASFLVILAWGHGSRSPTSSCRWPPPSRSMLSGCASSSCRHGGRHASPWTIPYAFMVALGHVASRPCAPMPSSATINPCRPSSCPLGVLWRTDLVLTHLCSMLGSPCIPVPSPPFEMSREPNAGLRFHHCRTFTRAPSAATDFDYCCLHLLVCSITDWGWTPTVYRPHACYSNIYIDYTNLYFYGIVRSATLAKGTPRVVS